ncbi:MAG: cysteine-rich small domain-containing protein [Eubacteriales bacterium]|nr:cysteine-rich small domain-containing protein [Eubacteriales bacterium]
MKDKNNWHGKHYAFYQNKECECFPCHKGADPESFNCLFCFCPLYSLGNQCGGHYTVTEKGIKSCISCLIPHEKDSYGSITGRFPEIAAAVAVNMKDDGEKSEDNDQEPITDKSV